MKRFVITIVICLLCVPVFASNFTPAKSATDESVLFVVGSTNTLYTKAISLKNQNTDHPIGVMYKATAYSGNTVDLRLDVEQSFKLPATEGASDSNYLTYVIDSSTTDESWYLATIDTTILPYMRFKVIGQGSNNAGTLFQIKVIR